MRIFRPRRKYSTEEFFTKGKFLFNHALSERNKRSLFVLQTGHEVTPHEAALSASFKRLISFIRESIEAYISARFERTDSLRSDLFFSQVRQNQYFSDYFVFTTLNIAPSHSRRVIAPSVGISPWIAESILKPSLTVSFAHLSSPE